MTDEQYIPFEFLLADNDNAHLLMSLFKSERRFTTRSFKDKGERLDFRLPEVWLRFVQKVVQQRLDPELEYYSDIILDALHRWIVNFLEQNPELQKTGGIGHEFKLLEIQAFLDELDSYYTQAEALLFNLKKTGYVHGLHEFVNDTTVAYYHYSEHHAPESFLTKLQQLTTEAQQFLSR